MAENSFSRLTPASPIAGASVERVGPGWGGSLGQAGAEDTRIHLPMPWIPPAAPEPPAPLPPTEAELRSQLAAALVRQRVAITAVADLAGLRSRAVALVEARQEALRAHDGLDDALTAQTLADLRSPAPEVATGALDRRIVAREASRHELAAAESALRVIRDDSTAAEAELEAANKSVRRLVVQVLGCVALSIARQRESLLRQAAQLFGRLLQFDRYSAGSGATLPGPVAAALLSVGTQALLKSQNTADWEAAAAVLRADPMAEIELPAPPVSEAAEPVSVAAVVPIGDGSIVDTRTGERYTPQEFFARRQVELKADAPVPANG